MNQLDFNVRRISGVRVYSFDDDDSLESSVAVPSVVLDSIIDDYELSLSGQLDALKKYSRLFIAMEQLRDAIEDLTDLLADDVK
jgi:hypothetical protein